MLWHPITVNKSQTHYARWIQIHLHDLVSLLEHHPDVFAEFVKGNFIVRKSRRIFSATAIDQAHEQNNASVDGSAVGLTENPAALHRWMVYIWYRNGSFN